MKIVFRISKIKHAAELQGVGAMLHPGRWNNIGTPMVYTSGTRSLAALEYRVNIQDDTIPDDLAITEIIIPDHLPHHQILTTEIPDGWRNLPYSEITQKIGDRFIAENKWAYLLVPSAIIPQELNVLINPQLIDSYGIKVKSVELFSFDNRLM